MNRLLSATLATIIISGCGGSGGGTPTERLLPPPPSASGVSITGTATKGPLDSSDLEFLPIDAFGDVSGSAVVTAVTAADGSFSAIIPQGSGALLVRSSGGSYIDEADREPNPALKRRITLGAGEGLESLLPPGTTSVTISIATQALLDKTRRESTGDTFLQHFAANRALAEAAFGFDIVSTAPANPVSPDPGLAEAQRQYAMVLGGLANLVSRVSIDAGFPDPTIETILAVVRDFSDGEVDGLEDGTVVMVAGAPMGVYSLNEEITRFRNNNFDSYSSTPLIAVDESVFSQPGIPINTTPMAVGDSYSLDVGATLTIDAPGVLLNDTDADGDALTAVALVGPANATAFSLAPDGSFTYTHNGSSLDPDSFSYTAGDGVNDSNAAIVTLTFTNTAPVASDDADTVLEGGTLNGASVLDNDTDAEGNSLVAILVTGPVNAADFFLDSDGTFFYAHDGGETAQDQFSYIANDGVDDSAPANVVINITPVNDPPIAQDDNINVDQGATQTILTDGAISVLNNDSDAEGDALTAALVIPPTSGQLTLNPDGTFVYSHDGSQTATDQFTYMVSDGIANSNVVPVFITVNPPGNTPPVAIDDSLSVAQGGIQSVLNSGLDSVLDNDFDNDQDPLAATLVDPPNNGQLTLFADGRFEYQHDGSQTQGDQFTYVANDGTDDSNIATVDVCVVGTNSGLINSYDFNGDLSDTLANGVDLVASGGAVDVGRYFFEPNQGLRLTQALPCVTDYAVEIRFQVNDEVLEFNKLIDFQELASDPGVYIFEGGINFFPQPDVAGLLALDTDFTVGIARAAGQVEVYLDGNLLFSFADVENVAVPLQNVLNFFVDDFGTLQGESFAGSVDFIRIHNDASTFGTQPNGNNPPTGIILDNTSVDEGQPIDTIVGTLSTIDPDCCDAHIITFVPGPGSDDNALFRLTSSAGVFSLRTAAVFDAAQTPTLSIRLQTDDQDNQGDGTFQQAFTITVNPSGGGNSPPIALDIDNFTVVEGQPTGTTVGNFTTTDPDTGDTHIYSLVAGAGDTDNALFDIAGATLITAAVLDFQQGQIRSIRVRTDDQNGGTLDQIFIIVVEPAGNVPPTAINLDNLTVLEGEPAGTPVGTLTSADANLGDVHLYTLVAGAGGEDNAFFSIVGDELQTATTLDAAQTPTLSVRIRTDDQNGGTFEEFFPIIVLSQLSDNANLASLTLLNVTLVPPFDPSTLNYTATVPFTVSSTQVSPTSESAGATITFNGFPVASGSVSTLGLAEGDNAITIGVTSEDGLTTNIYTVTITRQSAAAFAQSAYIKASNTGASDRFGFSDNFTPTALSADGNTLAVGASEEGSAATGINGNQGDDSAS
ncbi:MAG: Ig-like domain-containing protein, partial [Gammaproteobacteria bacterium]|nr:Ig-like domain-containing protein [Gammaproteobacteria bacterium]